MQLKSPDTISNKLNQSEIINDKTKILYRKKLSSYILKNKKIYNSTKENENKLIKNILRKNNSKSYECVIFKKIMKKKKKQKNKKNKRNKTYDIISEKHSTPIKSENDKGGKVNLSSYINQKNPHYNQNSIQVTKYCLPINKICYITKNIFLFNIKKIVLLQKKIKKFLLKKKKEKENITIRSVSNSFDSNSINTNSSKKFDSKKLNKRNVNRIYFTNDEVRYEIGNYVCYKKNKSPNKYNSKINDKNTTIKTKMRNNFLKRFKTYDNKKKSQRNHTPNSYSECAEEFTIINETNNQILSNKNIYMRLPINKTCIFTKQINILNKKIKPINKFKLINIKGGYISKTVKNNHQLFLIKYLQKYIKYYMTNKKNNSQKKKEIIFKPIIKNSFMTKEYKIKNNNILRNSSLIPIEKDYFEYNNNISQSLITESTKRNFYNKNIILLLKKYFNDNKIKLFCSKLKNIYFNYKFNPDNFVNINFKKHPKKRSNSTEFRFSFNNNDIIESEQNFSNTFYHDNSFKRRINYTIEKINNNFNNNEDDNEEIDIFKKRKKDTQCLVQNAIINQIFKEYKNENKKCSYSEDSKNLNIRGSKSKHVSNLSSSEHLSNKKFDKEKDEYKEGDKLSKKKEQYL